MKAESAVFEANCRYNLQLSGRRDPPPSYQQKFTVLSRLTLQIRTNESSSIKRFELLTARALRDQFRRKWGLNM